MSENRKSCIRHYILYILPITFFLIFILGLLFTNLSSYVGGVKGTPFILLSIISFAPFLVFVILFILLLFIPGFILAFVNLIRVIIYSCKTKKVQWLELFLTLIPFLIFAAVYTGVLPFGSPVKSFLRGYEKYVKKTADIPAIQEWLISLPPEYSGQRFFEASDFPEKLPTSVKILNPYHMYFSEFEAEKRSVEFEWGCALQHFGIVIGQPGMEAPQGEEYVEIDDYTSDIRRPIQSGVYIFSRD
jgi:hypothetical protein